MPNGTSSLRVYFDPEAGIDFDDDTVMGRVCKQATHALTRVSPSFDWADVAVTVYYYPGGIEHDPRHGDYQRGEGFYADIRVSV